MCARMKGQDELRRLRAHIDRLDRRIVALLHARGRLAVRIARQKSTRPVRLPARERDVIAQVTAQNRGPLATPHLRAIYQAIMRACLAVQVASFRRRT